MDKFTELLNEYNKGRDRDPKLESDFYVKRVASAGSRVDRNDHVIYSTYVDSGMSRGEAVEFLKREVGNLEE